MARKEKQIMKSSFFNEDGEEMFIIVPNSLFDDLLKMDTIEKEQIKEDSMLAFIDTVYGKGWTRIYRTKYLPTDNLN